VKKNRAITQNKRDDDFKKESSESSDSKRNKKTTTEDSDSAENETEAEINENGKRRICVVDICSNVNVIFLITRRLYRMRNNKIAVKIA